MKILLFVIIGFISKPIYCQSHFEYNDTIFEVNGIKIIRFDDKEPSFSLNDLIMDSLYCFLIKNNSVTIEIGAHSHCKGGAEYNLIYTEKLAATVKNELVSKGVPDSRIKTKGYSNLNPIYQCESCDKCSSEALYINKRLEIKILEINQK